MFKENRFTAAIDGKSERPGEPCETSIPRIMVTGLETKGIERECSSVNKEFIPPSCRNGEKIQPMVSSRHEKTNMEEEN